MILHCSYNSLTFMFCFAVYLLVLCFVVSITTAFLIVLFKVIGVYQEAEACTGLTLCKRNMRADFNFGFLSLYRASSLKTLVILHLVISNFFVTNYSYVSLFSEFLVNLSLIKSLFLTLFDPNYCLMIWLLACTLCL